MGYLHHAGHRVSKIYIISKGAVTCAVCPESAWLVTFLIGNVSTGVVTWSALRCGASGESGKKVAAAPLSKTAAAAAAAETWFAKHPLDYMLHNNFPWKRSGRRSSMWPPYSLRRNLSAAACRSCDRSLKGTATCIHNLEPIACCYWLKQNQPSPFFSLCVNTKRQAIPRWDWHETQNHPYTACI